MDLDRSAQLKAEVAATKIVPSDDVPLHKVPRLATIAAITTYIEQIPGLAEAHDALVKEWRA